MGRGPTRRPAATDHGLRRARRAAAVLAAASALVAVGFGPSRALAQTAPSGGTTDSTTTSTTTGVVDTTTVPPTTEPPTTEPPLPSTVPPTIAPPPTTTTSTTAPPSNSASSPSTDPLAGESDPPVAVPAGVVPVPPRAVPRSPTPVDAALALALTQQATQAQAALASAEAGANAADAKVAAIEAKVADVQHQVDALRSDQQDAIWNLAATRSRLVRRAVAAYVGGSIAPLGNILQVKDINELDRDLQIENEASRAQLSTVKAYDQARAKAGSAADALTASMDRLGVDLSSAQSGQADAHQLLAAVSGQASAASVDPTLIVDGFVFPVLGPHKLDRNFGDPRNVGTPYFHLHQGDDVEAPEGAPLVAVVRGVVVNISSSTLGGNGLWIQGADGTKYYYAHLSAYAPGLTVGQVVEAGQLVGLVGATGDATGPHLHFEVHPNGGPAIDPWSLLSAIDAIQAQTQTSDAVPAAAGADSTTTTTLTGG